VPAPAAPVAAAAAPAPVDQAFLAELAAIPTAGALYALGDEMDRAGLLPPVGDDEPSEISHSEPLAGIPFHVEDEKRTSTRHAGRDPAPAFFRGWTRFPTHRATPFRPTLKGHAVEVVLV
jgi:hypothetical protein